MAGAIFALVLLLPAACPAGPYRPPVDAPVVDPFRLPDGPFRAGNRGLKYATVAGQVVRSIGAGEVSFAGQVARQLHVSVRHGDGLVSSYSFLAAISVRRGDVVSAGQQVGLAADLFHLGVRRDGNYVDPAPLLRPRTAPRLVPDRRFGTGDPCVAAAERRWRRARRHRSGPTPQCDPPRPGAAGRPGRWLHLTGFIHDTPRC